MRHDNTALRQCFDVEIYLPALAAPASWTALFGNRNPVELEIGTGRGRFLIDAAGKYPDVNFLGVEVSLKWMRVAKGRIEEAGLTNIRLARTEAAHFFDRYVPSGSLRAVHCYFPDPWPKRRHAKRRLFRWEMGNRFARCLAPGGRILVATDQDDYFNQILGVLDEETAFRRLFTGTVSISTLPRTHFEEKYLAEGRSIHRAEFHRA
ncbi:MAG: tRNA (guanosine(46)-N7)-methyltransferase TrmB [Acidobacteria bacterium]|nr:tRNA (guanosine(46)-N7)-methyltransferase TrmB [Acidobacteriota bacterium]